MAIRDDITINWLVSPRVIEIAIPSTELTIQELYDTLRSLGASIEAIGEPEIIDGSGKEDLGGGTLVGLTVKLFNAKVKFEDRSSPTECNISGGNLVAFNASGQSMNPIQYATNVTVTYAKSSSATLLEQPPVWESLSQIDYGADSMGEKLKSIISNVSEEIVENNLSLFDTIKIMLSVLAGKTSGGDGNVLTFRDTGNTTDRVIATVDANSNRTDIVLDVD